MKILLSDGSSLAARQAAGILGRSGHDVGVLSRSPTALTSWTRHVRHHHRCPPYGNSPLAWLDVALAVTLEHHYDLLLPTQEQAAALSAAADVVAAAGVRTVVPPFAALAAVQDKATASRTLDRLDIPQPPTVVVSSAEELAAALESGDRWYVKSPIATASQGVRLIDEAHDLAGLETPTPNRPLVLQVPVDGPLVMVQTVWCRGRLLAAHANRRTEEGASGGASEKISLDCPDVIELVGRLGAALRWHGALCADVILTSDGPVVIDVNPRLVEPGSAAASGVDLVGALVEAAFDRGSPAGPSRAGVVTRQALVGILGSAERGEGRRGVARQATTAWRTRREVVEELTPTGGDPCAAVPLVLVAMALLARPSLAGLMSRGSVAGYALSPDGWDELVVYAGGVADDQGRDG